MVVLGSLDLSPTESAASTALVPVVATKQRWIQTTRRDLQIALPASKCALNGHVGIRPRPVHNHPCRHVGLASSWHEQFHISVQSHERSRSGHSSMSATRDSAPRPPGLRSREAPAVLRRVPAARSEASAACGEPLRGGPFNCLTAAAARINGAGYRPDKNNQTAIRSVIWK